MLSMILNFIFQILFLNFYFYLFLLSDYSWPETGRTLDTFVGSYEYSQWQLQLVPRAILISFFVSEHSETGWDVRYVRGLYRVQTVGLFNNLRGLVGVVSYTCVVWTGIWPFSSVQFSQTSYLVTWKCECGCLWLRRSQFHRGCGERYRVWERYQSTVRYAHYVWVCCECGGGR